MHDLTAAPTTVNFAYAYDPANRADRGDRQRRHADHVQLRSKRSADRAGTTTYSYDPNGNQTGGGQTIGVDNELTSDGTYNYTYDHAGNLATKTLIAGGETWTYAYDNENHLISAVESNAWHGTPVDELRIRCVRQPHRDAGSDL